MKVTTIGIDIAKRIFQIHGVDKNGKTVLNSPYATGMIERYNLSINCYFLHF